MILTVRTIAKIFCVLAAAGVLFSGEARAMTDEENAQVQEEMKDYKFKHVTTKEGLNFNIPEDMPIETRNGVTGPIPFEEYLYFKLKRLDERLAAIDKKIDGLLEVFNATKKQEAARELSLQEKAGLLSST